MDFSALLRRQVPLQWLTRDAWMFILARASRTFGRGAVGVLLAIYLNLIGFSVVQIGMYIGAGAAGAALLAFVVALIGDTLGRRRLLVLFSLATATAGLTLVLTDQFLILATAAFFGSFVVGGGGYGGPIQPLESACLPETAPAERRTDLFAISGIVSTASGALGTLAAVLPAVFQGTFNMSEVSSYKVMFVAFALLLASQALFYSLLSPAVEVRTDTRQQRRRWNNPLRLRSRRFIFSLTGIWSIDHFATGLLFQSLVALWFFTKFEMELGSIALIFFGSQIMASLSLWIAAKLANRFGLVNTIVFSHVPGTLILVVIPFVPYGWLAAILWLVRGFTNLMDTPAKQSYSMGVVAADERSAMGGINNTARNTMGTVSPIVGTVLWSSFFIGAPFLASAVVKAVYLTSMFFTFRNVKPPEEQQRTRHSQEAAAQGAEASGPPPG